MAGNVRAFFNGQPESRRLFIALHRVARAIGPFTVRVTKSQISFRRRQAFAWAWMPGAYLKRAVAPLVLTLRLPRRDPSPRWKQVVEPAPGQFTHHLELFDVQDIDAQVKGWLAAAWRAAL